MSPMRAGYRVVGDTPPVALNPSIAVEAYRTRHALRNELGVDEESFLPRVSPAKRV